MVDSIQYKIVALRQGAYFKELAFDTASSPRVDFNASGEIKSSFVGRVKDITDLIIGSDELQPMIKRGSSDWESLGVFRITGLKERGTEFSKDYQLEGYDRCWVLKQRKTTSVLHYPSGTGYFNVITGLIQACGFALIVQEAPINADIPAAAAFADEREWDLVTDYLTIINELLTELGYNELWFDSIGAAHLEPYKPPLPESIQHRYSESNSEYAAVGTDYSSEEDFFDAPNVFVVCSNNPESGILYGRAVNDNLFSKKSTINRGVQITEVITISEAYNNASCEELAKKYRDASMMAQQDIEFYSYNEAGHGLNDIIALDYSPIIGLYIETGWTVRMSPGALMRHKARRTIV